MAEEKSSSVLHQLLDLHDESFIEQAYEVVLGRASDPVGSSFYLKKLRSGCPKERILVELRISAEGRAHDLNVSGLNNFIKMDRLSNIPGVGKVFAYFFYQRNSASLDRRLRIIENFANSENQKLRSKIDNLEKIVADLVESAGGILKNSSAAPDILDEGRLSPDAKRIYRYFLDADAKNNVGVNG